MFTAASVTRVSITVNSAPLAPTVEYLICLLLLKAWRCWILHYPQGVLLSTGFVCYSYNHVCSLGIWFLPMGGGGGGGQLDLCVQDGRTETERGAGFKMIRICVFSCLFFFFFFFFAWIWHDYRQVFLFRWLSQFIVCVCVCGFVSSVKAGKSHDFDVLENPTTVMC